MSIRDWLPEISEYLQETLWVHGFGRIPDSFLAPSPDEHALDRYIFISYSRRELFFAESLAKGLQANGLHTWLDVERLQPGEDWQAQIEDSLAACEALVLVASETALASGYVRREWEKALDYEKPIYLAIFEAVELPRWLKCAGAVDFRANFGRATHRLANCLKGKSGFETRIPKPNLFNLPTKLSPGVLLVTCAFLMLAVWVMILIRRLPPLLTIPPWITGAGLLIMELALLAIFWRFLHRQLGREQVYTILGLPLKVTLYGAVVLLVVNFLLSDLQLIDLVAEWPAWRGLFSLSFLVSILSSGCGLASQYSADFLRWSPMELAELDDLRSRIYRHRYQENQGFKAAVSIDYAIHHDPADEPVAQALHEAMAQTGHRQVSPTASGMAQHLVILSNWTQCTWLSDLPCEMEQVIPVIGSNLRNPADPQLTGFLKRQVVDFRDRQPDELEGLAQHLAHPESQYVLYDVDHLPHILERWLVPNPVKKRSISLIATASLGLAVALFGNGVHLLSGLDQVITRWLTLFSAGLLAWLSYRLLKRDLSRRWNVALLAVAVTGLARPIIAELLAFLSMWSITDFGGWPARLAQEPTLSLLALFVAAYATNQYRADLSTWLPAPTSPSGKGERLGSPSPRKFWLQQSLITAATTAGGFFLWISLFKIFQG